MDLKLDIQGASNYSSHSQKIRVMSEYWVEKEIFCPNCGSCINQFENNKPVSDFFCSKCSEEYELKSKKKRFGKKVSAGAYSKMIQRISSVEKPNFFFMAYENDMWVVKDFFVVPKHFFVPDIIEKRKPLAKNAKRAGWVGSNLLFSKIPNAGKIFYVENGSISSKREILDKWKRTIFLKEIKKPETKGWILDVMNCIDTLNKKEFTLQEIYSFEEDLAKIYPENKHIKDKIRQQLQVLRDKGYLEFIGSGKYRLIS